MNKNWNHRIFLLLAVLLVVSGTILADPRSDDNVWERINKAQLQQRGFDAATMPDAYEAFRLDKTALEVLLNNAPEEYSGSKAVVLSLPMPDGTFCRFEIEHSLVVERGLLTNYPELGATYRGRGIDNPTATVRFDLLPSGFHSMILSANGTVIVDPYSGDGKDEYISFFKRDHPRSGTFVCDFKSDTKSTGFAPLTKTQKFDPGDFLPDVSGPEVLSGTQLRTYRLALAADNEYCVAVGGNTIAGSLAAEVLIMNRVNGV